MSSSNNDDAVMAMFVTALFLVFLGGVLFFFGFKFNETGQIFGSCESGVPVGAGIPVDSSKVKIGYKLVEAGNGILSMSFEVPSDWLVETRHDGSRKLNDDEIREFLATKYNGDIKKDAKLTSDYTDLTWKSLEKMSSANLHQLYNKDYPDVSVAKKDGQSSMIQYTDWNANQVDFALIKAKDLDKEKAEMKKQSNKIKWSKTKVSSYEAEVAEIPVLTSDKPTKGTSGGKVFYVKLNSGDYFLMINKQAAGDEKFEKDFENILATLKFK